MPDAAVTIDALSPGSAAAFFRFFDGEAFEDNAQWAGCYCRFPFFGHARGRWKDETAAQNRSGTAARIARRGNAGLPRPRRGQGGRLG